VRRPRLEVADVFDRHGVAWRRANAGHVSLGQLQVMSAIVSCRTAALGGHIARCEDCGHTQIAYNSLYGAITVKLIFNRFHLLVRPTGDHLLVPT
jgi:Transposase zinc-binding domain